MGRRRRNATFNAPSWVHRPATYSMLLMLALTSASSVGLIAAARRHSLAVVGVALVLGAGAGTAGVWLRRLDAQGQARSPILGELATDAGVALVTGAVLGLVLYPVEENRFDREQAIENDRVGHQQGVEDERIARQEATEEERVAREERRDNIRFVREIATQPVASGARSAEQLLELLGPLDPARHVTYLEGVRVALAGYDDREVAHAVDRIVQLGDVCTNPIGLLVDRANSDDPVFFPAAIPSTASGLRDPDDVPDLWGPRMPPTASEPATSGPPNLEPDPTLRARLAARAALDAACQPVTPEQLTARHDSGRVDASPAATADEAA